MKMKNQKKAGFTLVELMVVAIIVAILAAVAIPLMTGNKRRAAATEAQAACSTIQTAQQAWRAEHGAYYSDSTDPHDLPTIRDGDLAGKYFPDTGYEFTAVGDDSYTIQGTADYADDADIDGETVTLTVTLAADGTLTSEWGGTLLD